MVFGIESHVTQHSESDADYDVGPAIGSTIGGKYLIEALLGRGGMGAVYRARHLVTGRRVAIKWLLDHNPSLRARFLREARAMGFVEHESVVSVLDVGEHEGAAFIVMELLRGQSLREYLDGRPCTVSGAIEILMPALEGLAAVHMAGIVHRDLKPDNVFVCMDAEGYVLTTKLLDLGVARLRDSRLPQDDLTVSGAIIGTPRYMSPEQLRGIRDVDARADIFAVGLILYEMFTGRLPFDASSYESLVIDIATSDPPSPRVFKPELPEALASVVLKALSRERDKRFGDVAALATALEPYAENVRFKPPSTDHVRASFVPDDPFDSGALTTDEVAPRISAEPTAPQRRGAAPVVPLRRGTPANTPRVDPGFAEAGTLASDVTTDRGLSRVPASDTGRRAAYALVFVALLVGGVVTWRAMRAPPDDGPSADATEPTPSVAAPSLPTPTPASTPSPEPVAAPTQTPLGASVQTAPTRETTRRTPRVENAQAAATTPPPSTTMQAPPGEAPVEASPMTRTTTMLQVDEF